MLSKSASREREAKALGHFRGDRHTPGPSSNSARRASTFCYEIFNSHILVKSPTGAYLVASRATLHRHPQHAELPPESTSSLEVDDGRVLVQFLNEGFVNPVVTSKIPCLAPRQLANENADQYQTHWYGASVRQHIEGTVPSSHHDKICCGIRNTTKRLLWRCHASWGCILTSPPAPLCNWLDRVHGWQTFECKSRQFRLASPQSLSAVR